MSGQPASYFEPVTQDELEACLRGYIQLLDNFAREDGREDWTAEACDSKTNRLIAAMAQLLYERRRNSKSGRARIG